MQSSIHPTLLPFFLCMFQLEWECFPISRNQMPDRIWNSNNSSQHFIYLKFHTGTFPLFFQDKERHLWNTFQHACEMHSSAGLQEARQSAGSVCRQVVSAETWGSFPAACAQPGAALPSRLHQAQSTRAVLGRWRLLCVCSQVQWWCLGEFSTSSCWIQPLPPVFTQPTLWGKMKVFLFCLVDSTVHLGLGQFLFLSNLSERASDNMLIFQCALKKEKSE